MLTIDRVLKEVQRLPEDWHIGGTVSSATLQAIVKHVADLDVSHSMETGSGRTTLLFSHLSRDHKVFAVNDYGDTDTKGLQQFKPPLYSIELPSNSSRARHSERYPSINSSTLFKLPASMALMAFRFQL